MCLTTFQYSSLFQNTSATNEGKCANFSLKLVAVATSLERLRNECLLNQPFPQVYQSWNLVWRWLTTVWAYEAGKWTINNKWKVTLTKHIAHSVSMPSGLNKTQQQFRVVSGSLVYLSRWKICKCRNCFCQSSTMIDNVSTVYTVTPIAVCS